MGKLKQHCLSVLEDRGDEVLEHYDRFLIFAWKNREMPSGYQNAINYICKRTATQRQLTHVYAATIYIPRCNTV